MEVLAAVVGSILTCAGSCMNAPVDEQCRYLRDPTKQIKALKDKKEELIAREKDIKEKLKAEARQGKRRTEETQNWLDAVTNFVAEFDKMEEKFAVGRRCLKGVYPNCHSRVKLGGHITKLINDVNHLLQRADRISENPAHLVQEIGRVKGTTKLVGVAATQKITKMVWEHLMGDQVDIIGVYGMGGVGKTTIMKNINDQLIKESTHFNKVVWVSGSKDGNILTLQKGIGKVVDIDLSLEPDETSCSSLLLTKLPCMGRILFILDDMWEAFSLTEIGIPNLKENNCKLVLTTRSFEVCRRMGCKEPIKVELLSEDEAWELFIDIVDVKLAPEVENVARDIAVECSRLPLAIVTVASAMKGNDDIQEWRVALKDLRDCTDTNLGMEEKVFGPLKFSYNKLSEHDKKCFQYCALYPEDYEIFSENLIDHWVVNGLITEKRIQQELDRGRGILNRLVHSCMLERDYKGGVDREGNYIQREFVKMHDLVRDMAIGTVKTNPQFVVKAGLFLGESLNEKEWEEDAEKISYMQSDIRKIVVSPNCPRLTTLLLGGNYIMKYIAEAFFARMPNLRVLNLSSSSIASLPESLSELVNLHVLDASWNVYLKSVPSLQKLRSLRVLRLQKTAIQELPHGMEALVNLRRLDISYTKLREIPVSLITNFSLLQELLIYPCCISFSDPLRSLDSLVEQLLSLSNLERVSLNFTNFSDFICCARSKTLNHLDNFSFAVKRDDFNEHLPGRNKVHITNSSNAVSEDTLVLPQNTEVLQMYEFNEFSCFSELACLKDVRGLRKCRIEDCSGMECILSSSEHRNQLQHLESLSIKWCPKFITLCKGVAARGILPSLKTLEIEGCSNLKYLFASFKLFCQLQKLTSLEINGCPELEELIASEEAEEEQVNTEGSNTASPTLLESLELFYLPKLKTLLSKPMMYYFQNVKELEIYNCDGLKYLFSFEMLEHLKHLQKVDISSCEGLETLIAEVEVYSIYDNPILLPSLTELKLSLLPKLKSICTPHPYSLFYAKLRREMVCESLQTVHVRYCAELKRLPLLRGEDQLPPPSLQLIEGSSEWWDSLEWDSPFLKTILQPCFQEYKEPR